MRGSPVFLHTLHKELWLWLAEHPSCEKMDFLEKCKLPLALYDDLLCHHECPACLYADIQRAKNRNERCQNCPLDVRNIHTGHCDCLNGLHTRWTVAHEAYERMTVLNTLMDDQRLVSCIRLLYSIAKGVAEQIAHLPVRQGVVCGEIPTFYE